MCAFILKSMLTLQDSPSPNSGTEIQPHSQCQKSMFFSQFQTKNSQFDKKIFFFLHLYFIYDTNAEHIVT